MIKFGIGQIVRDDQGYWHVNWMGTSYGQGGKSFGPTNMGMKDIEDLLRIVAKDLKLNQDTYDEMIKDKLDDSSDK